MAYRGDFFMSVVIMIVAELIMPLLSILIYRNGASFPGWSLNEVLLLQAVFMMSKGIALPLFIGMVFNILYLVSQGSFDVLLLRPRSTLFIVITRSLNVQDFSKFFGGLIFFIVALLHLDRPDQGRWLGFVLLFLVSLLIMFAITVLMAACVVRWIGSYRIFDIYERVTNFGFYPGTIYASPIKATISYVLPIAMIAYFPAAFLLGKPVDGMQYAIIASFGFLAVSLWVWTAVLKKYTSAGG